MPEQTYAEFPKGIKPSKDLKEFREFAFLKISNPAEFETVFQGFCLSQALAQANKSQLALEQLQGVNND